MDELERNRRNVMAFYDLMFNDVLQIVPDESANNNGMF